MKARESIDLFLQQPQIAVIGISRNKNKFGNAVYSTLKKKGIKVYPVNPYMNEFDGSRCFHSIEMLPPEVKAVFVNTPPESTLKIVKIAINKGIQHMWLQQGSTDDTVITFLQGKDINYISDLCIMMFAQPVIHIHRFHRFISKISGNFPQ